MAADSTSLPTIMQVRDATVGPLFGTAAVSGGLDCPLVVVEAQGFRRDLRENCVCALADLRAGHQHAHMSLSSRLHRDHRRQILLPRTGKPCAVHERSKAKPLLHP